jgi:CRISPR-associated protein Csm5
MRQSINTSTHWKIEVLTPVHVGVGLDRAWKPGTDLMTQTQEVLLLDNSALYAQLYAKGRLNHYSAYLADGNFRDCAKEIEKVGDMCVLRRFHYPFASDLSIDGVRPLIRNGLAGQPYLPGSSLKGAIRSILFRYLRLKVAALARKEENKDVFGGIDNNLLRFFRFTDAELDQSKLMRVKIYNLHKEGANWEGGWKHAQKNDTTPNFKPTGFHTDLEVFPVGALGYLRYGVMEGIDQELWQKIIAKDNKHPLPQHHGEILKNPHFSLFRIINDHTRQYLKKQIAFFRKYPEGEHSAAITEKMDELYKAIPADNSYCLLKLAAGSGFHSITGDWRFPDDYTNVVINGDDHKATIDKKGNKKRYKSRKIAFEGNLFYPLGFIKISALSDAQLLAEQTERQAKAAEAARLAAEQEANAIAQQQCKALEEQEHKQREAQAAAEKESKKAEATPEPGKKVKVTFAKLAGSAVMVKAPFVNGEMELILTKVQKKDDQLMQAIRSGKNILGHYKREGKRFVVDFISLTE